MSYYNYKTSKNKRISLLGMSGVGKTHLAKILRKTGDWFHYSADYRIGTRYLDEAILDNIKKTMMQNDFLRPLLINDAIYINNNISFDNLLPVSSFLGKLGNPEQGALEFNEFNKRQQLHREAEINAMSDVVEFIDKALNIYDYPHFINDAGGSLCELDDGVIEKLAEHSLLIYLKTNKDKDKTLIQRAIDKPKPLYYHPDFLKIHLQQYLSINKLQFIAQIDTNDFVSWIFPKLFYYRLPKYEKIASKYGITIDSEALYSCQNANDFFKLINTALEHK